MTESVTESQPTASEDRAFRYKSMGRSAEAFSINSFFFRGGVYSQRSYDLSGFVNPLCLALREILSAA